MTAIFIAGSIVGAYLLGSIPSAYLVGKARKVTDIREVGTRNMGAMNVFYSVGFWWGMLVLLADIGKGMAAVAIAHTLSHNEAVVLLAGLMAVMGHGFPVFLKFRGGKGGATSIGVLAYLMPWGIPAYAGLFGLLLLVTRVPTISYSLAFICFPFIGWFVNHRWELVVYSAVLLIVPFVKYIPRIAEMRQRAGSWRRVLRRQNLKDRF